MLETLYLSNNFEMAIASLYHDAKTPIFSHVIDYMNKDYIVQESSEKQNESFILNNSKINKLCNRDNIDIELISNPQNFSIVDNDRPKLCIDRLDGIFLNSLAWTKEIELRDISNIYNNLLIIKNEDNEDEIGFETEKYAKMIHDLEICINKYCHSNSDNFAMFLLSDVVKHCINNKYIEKNEIYELTEPEVIDIINKKIIHDIDLMLMWKTFTSTSEVSWTAKVKTKKRYVNPIIENNQKRRLYSS